MTIMTRRTLLSHAAVALTLVGCTSDGGLNIRITLPPELVQAITYANDVIDKLDSLRSLLPTSVRALIDQGKGLLASIQSAISATTIQGLLADLLPIVQQVLSYIPTTSNVPTGGIDWSSIISAVQTVLPIIARVAGVVLPLIGLRAHPGRSMPLERAVAILRSR